MNTPSLRPATVPACLLSLLLAAASSSLLAQSDDFNDNNDFGWAHYDPLGGLGMWSHPGGNTYRIQGAPRPGAQIQLGQTRIASFRSSPSYTDFHVTVDLVNWNNSIDQALGLLARITTPGLGTTDGYAFTVQVQDTDISISRLDNEVPTDLSGSSLPWTANPAKDYRLEFIGSGPNFIGKIYELPNVDTPVITTTGIDATYSSGVCGLVVADLTSTSSATGVGCDGTFDNYAAVVAKSPKLSISTYDPGILRLSWPGESPGFTLEYTDTLPATNWTPVPADQIYQPGQAPFQGDNTFNYLEFNFGATYFFRLRRP